MCEQALQQNPSYFRKFAKNFRYLVSETYPNLPAENFGLSFHNTRSDACAITNSKHWHLLLYSENTNELKSGSIVPCPYACFAKLIMEGINIQFSGKIFDQLKTAVTYNEKYETSESRDIVLKKHLPKMPKMDTLETDCSRSNVLPGKVLKISKPTETNSSRPGASPGKVLKCPKPTKQNIAVQTDYMSSVSLERYFKVISGPYGGELSQIMDAFLSGYGSVNIQRHSMVTNFELTCSNAQCYCSECT